jgi:hypothetical protein
MSQTPSVISGRSIGLRRLTGVVRFALALYGSVAVPFAGGPQRVNVEN